MQNHELYDKCNDEANFSSYIFLRMFLIAMYLIVLNNILLGEIRPTIFFHFVTSLIKMYHLHYMYLPNYLNICTTSSIHEYTLPKHPLKFANGWLKLCHHEQKNCFRVLCRDSTPLYTHPFFNSMKNDDTS